MRVDFYHLIRTPAEGVLPALAERVIDGSGRLLVVSEDGDQLDRIDRALWAFKPDSFLPHAKADGVGDQDQPILLASATDALNAARNIAITDGVWRDAALGFDRIFYLFNPDAVEHARTAWRALGNVVDVERHYWKQDENGRWQEGP